MCEKLDDNKRKLVEDNINLVHFIIRKYFKNATKQYDDYFQTGCLGLCKAALNFDDSRDIKFSTYAASIIIGTIKRYRRDNNIIRYPRKIIDLRSKLLKYMSENGYTDISEMDSSDFDNLSKYLDISRNEYYEIWNSLFLTSLDKEITEDNKNNLYEIIADNIDDISFKESDIDLQNSISKLLESINSKYSDMFEEWLYSKMYGDSLGQQYLSDKYGISQAHVSRIINKYKRLLADLSGYDEFSENINKNKRDEDNEESVFILRNGKLKRQKKTKREKN